VSNLASRILVAAVGIPVILLAAFFGGWGFVALVSVMAILALAEFFRLPASKGVSPNRGLGMVFGMIVLLTFARERIQYPAAEALLALGIPVPLPSFGQAFLISVILLVTLLMTAEPFRKSPAPLRNIGTTLFGVLYIGLFFGSLIGLREIFTASEFPVLRHFHVTGIRLPEEVLHQIDVWGGMTVSAVFVTVWMCDSAAYFTGRAFGRRKLWPRVSPNKTWEGAVAGLLVSVVTFVLLRGLALPYLSLGEAVVSGCVIGVVGQFGDLAESLLKREAGMKDSSSLLPGHGGVLDRFDSLLFAAPVLFLYYDFIVFAR